MLKRLDMSKPTKSAEPLKIIQIAAATHADIKSTAAKSNISMPNAATQLVNIALATNPDLERD